MDIRVSGHQLATGAALQEHASDRLNAIVDKYFNRALSSQVTFGKAPANAFACDIVVHVMHGLTVKAHGEAHDAHHAFDAVIEKIDKQLRRYKRRLNDRHEQSAYALREEEAAYTVFAPEEPEADVESDAPLVIAETRVDIPVTTVSDAVMMLDLRHTNALLFKNAGTGQHNMVYRRDDGSIGWVEPS
jgi:ribosomal subunit interface protein